MTSLDDPTPRVDIDSIAHGDRDEVKSIDVIISYAHGDIGSNERAKSLCAALQARGIHAIYDKALLRDAGNDWHAALTAQFNTALVVAALWSPLALSRPMCIFEAKLAAAVEDKLLPFEVEPVGREHFTEELHNLAYRHNRVAYVEDDAVTQIVNRVNKRRESIAREKLFVRTAPLAPSQAALADERVQLQPVFTSGSGFLAGRDIEESLLTDAWASCAPGADSAGKTHILVMHAIGGAGKTALMRRLVDRLAPQNWPHAEKVIGWSAYSQGAGENSNADAEGFVIAALRALGEIGQLPLSSEERGRLLALRMRTTRTLMLLDGIEPLQSAPDVNQGRLKDRGLQYFLQQIALSGHPGLIVINSRQPLPELENTPAPRVRTHELEALSPAAGATLLRHLGCRGRPQELEDASREALNHALSIALLGTYIRAVEFGDIARRDSIGLSRIIDTPKELQANQQTARFAKRAGAIMRAYIARFEARERESPQDDRLERVALTLVGLFNRPADGPAMAALLAGPPIPGVTDAYHAAPAESRERSWRAALSRLRDLKLLSPADANDPTGLDAHPLVRDYFGKTLKETAPEAHRAAHERLWRHYEKACVKDLPDTLDEMQPLFHAIGHACAAGGHEEAFRELYYRRVLRRNEKYIVHQFGAYAADLGALAAFFDAPWGGVSENLSPPCRGAVLNYAAFALRGLGRLAEAEAPEAAGLELAVAQRNWKNAAIAASNLSELRLTLGRVVAAVEAARQAVEHADRSKDAGQMMITCTALADALAQAGQGAEALDLFQDAEAPEAQREPAFQRLYSLQGYQYCDLLLGLGRAAEVRERAAYMEQLFKDGVLKSLLSKSMGDFADARALALLAAHGEAGASAAAIPRLDEAVAALRRAGSDDRLPWGLLARARFYVHVFAQSRDPAHLQIAHTDLADVQDIASRGQMKLHLTDHALECARLALAHIPGAPPEALIPLDPPLVEEVEIVIEPPPARKLSFFDRLLGKKPPPPPEPERRKETRVVSAPQNLAMTRTAPVTAEDRAHLADAEGWYAQAFDLVQETGYHRRDRELEDLRRRMDALT